MSAAVDHDVHAQPDDADPATAPTTEPTTAPVVLPAPDPAATLAAAQAFRDRGWRPFPIDHPALPSCASGHSTRPCDGKRGKHPVGGWATMTASAQADGMLERWFAQPRNIGIGCAGSRLLVLDDDADMFESWCAEQGYVIPPTYRVRTSRGWHWYFSDPEREFGNTTGALPEWIDIRGARGGAKDAGGYVVAAGSWHATGVEYLAEDPWSDVAPVPGFLRMLLRSPKPTADPKAPSAPQDGWTEEPRYGYRDQLLGQYTRHLRGIRTRGGEFRHELYLAALDGWRCTNLGIIDRGTMLDGLVAAIRRVWGAEPDGNDEHIVYVEAQEKAVKSPWELLDPPAAASSETGPGSAAGSGDDAAGGAEGGRSLGKRTTALGTSAPVTAGPMLHADLGRGYRSGATGNVYTGEGVEEVSAEELDERLYQDEVASRLRSMKITRDARQVLEAEDRPPDPGPELASLTALLAEPDDGETWRIDGLWPDGGKVLLSAPQKSGKTTMIGNLVGALADGRRFLARQTALGEWKTVSSAGFETVDLEGRRIALFDFEMTRRKLREWLRDQMIANTAGVHVELMRGRVWDVRDATVRQEWAQQLAALDVGVIIVDPIGPILGSLGIDENDNSAVGAFLFALDALVRESGASELLVVHHAGHGAERARGASAFLGWPDANWTIVRDEETNTRAFKAEGRDVWVQETALVYDRNSRRLALGDGDRTSARSAEHAEIMAEIVSTAIGETLNGLKKLARDTEIGNKVQHAQDAVLAAERAGLIHVHQGPNRSRLHYPGECSGTCTGRHDPRLDPR